MLSLRADRCSSYVDAEASKWAREGTVQEQGGQCRLESLRRASIPILLDRIQSST